MLSDKKFPCHHVKLQVVVEVLVGLPTIMFAYFGYLQFGTVLRCIVRYYLLPYFMSDGDFSARPLGPGASTRNVS